MRPPKRAFVIPVLIMCLGVAWLLNTMAIVPGVDWVWTLSLGGLGMLILTFGGLNKLTGVAGPFFLIASVFSVLRQTGRLSFDFEVSYLVIIIGLLLLLVQLAALPMPDWWNDAAKRD